MPVSPEKVRVLIDGARSAIRRARYVFGAINVAGVILLAAQFNQAFPWIRNAQARAEASEIRERAKDRLKVKELLETNVDIHSPKEDLGGLGLSPGDRIALANQADASENGIWTWTDTGTPLSEHTTRVEVDAENPNGTSQPAEKVSRPWRELVTDVRRRHKRNDSEKMEDRLGDIWHETLGVVTVPLVGVRFSVHDLSVVGSVAMAILVVWLFYCVRTENYAITVAMDEATKVIAEDKETAITLYHGVSSEFVFTSAVENDVPLGREPRFGPRLAFQALFYMPAWVPLVVVFIDVYTLVRESKIGNTAISLWETLGPGERREIGLRELMALSLCLFAWSQCRKCALFDDATRQKVKEVRERL